MWIVTILVPFVLIVGGIRLIMTPLFLQIEYRTPNFPTDRYGFTLEDRLYWAQIALDILVNHKDVTEVENLRFEDGTPVYNTRELRHWEDVLSLWRVVIRVWYGGLIFLIGLGVLAWQAGWTRSFRMAIGRGGLLTVGLMGAVLLFAILAFGVIFVAFHQVFFDAGTWQFFYSDTFIRLFPERFWRDTFIFLGIFTGGIGMLLWYFLVRKYN
jgi:integral membrane protein (TIGR01906 family)